MLLVRHILHQNHDQKGVYSFMKQEIHIPENLSLRELMDHQHGLFGEVTIHRRNKLTGETTFWYQDHNIIPISGMQWILMKMFGLYLDTPHGVSYENLGKDTTLVIPELNQSSVMGIGVKPVDYSTMDENISSNHICQGFMIGNGGSGEDQLTTKNTDYSFIKLRNPIPFQQTQSTLPSEISAKYMGKLQTGPTAFAKSYYIKRFDETPHIYHSWWKDGQKWDYVDPVVPNDLGPNAPNGAGKTNRIETYVECKLTLSEDDFVTYFSHDGNNQTPAINELGLVAFDATASGDHSTLERLYQTTIKPIIDIIFANATSEADIAYLKQLSQYAYEQLTPLANRYQQENLELFAIDLGNLYTALNAIQPGQSVDTLYASMREQFSSDDEISVKAYYDQNSVYQFSTDSYMDLVNTIDFPADDMEDGQRIKLITYYTFKSIPIEENWETLINYRIYAN